MSAAQDLDAEIRAMIPRLSAEQKAQALAYLRTLVGAGRPAPRRAKAADLRELAGSIPREDLELMKRVIEEDCEGIDPDAW